jgi:FkbM family methyltransferase
MKGVVQIGAHYGEEHEGWLALGVENFIYFEPVRRNYIKLKKIIGNKPNIKLYNIALGNMKGEIMMHTETEHQGKSCSILKPTGHLDQYPDIEFDGKEVVQIDRLDNIEYDRKLYDHLHIDTQGYELEVLKGAVNSLDHIKTIDCEVYRKELYEGCADWLQITNLLDIYGYKLIEVYWRGLTWGDAKFKRRI